MSETSAPRTNRRLTARHACHLTVRYRLGPDWHPATAMDLSMRGCRVRLDVAIPDREASRLGMQETAMRDAIVRLARAAERSAA